MMVCPLCDCPDVVSGYGYAAGPLGSYTFCEGCNELIDFCPDFEGFNEDDIAMLTKWDDVRRETLANRIRERGAK